MGLLDFELAKSVGGYFKLSNSQMNTILNEVAKSVSEWQKTANKNGISRSEQKQMSGAFRF